MTEAAAAALSGLLAGLGVRRGDTVFLGVDMARVPMPRWPAALDRAAVRAREERLCAFLFDRLMDAIGPDGTLLVPTYSYRCANPDNAFVVEETESEVGPFTEWLRRRPGTLRSVHPVFSVAGVGRHAADILANTGRAAFGPGSPFGRLARFGARFVSLGVPFHLSVTYLHHLEQCYGCNHRYNKAFATPVFKGGHRLPGPFLGYMRWLGVDAGPDFRACERRLLAEGLMIERRWNGRVNQAVRVEDVDRIGNAMLDEDPCAFASRTVRVDLDERAVAANPSGDEVAVFRLT
ncbi:MAG: AAC(3) family N-acetyltransferase [Proteobacteria bacterium]|nr:AAC(3) family N-acetyltransferase [Pseudomonadota bacterium]